MGRVQLSDEPLKVGDMDLSLGTNHAFQSRNAETLRSPPLMLGPVSERPVSCQCLLAAAQAAHSYANDILVAQRSGERLPHSSKAAAMNSNLACDWTTGSSAGQGVLEWPLLQPCKSAALPIPPTGAAPPPPPPSVYKLRLLLGPHSREYNTVPFSR
ncbi:unnamed protein product [Pleuronectes platessa]|uniref:Uncharacterized protein n=1 Tax=Pleuronectes platessa TaxID=8262 RepID=A0A9N7UTA4_PLEPL|nr:unnamed protein product [Pleuronectes platessa]